MLYIQHNITLRTFRNINLQNESLFIIIIKR